MRWAVVRFNGKVQVCIPETGAGFALLTIEPGKSVPALVGLGVSIPLAGRPGIVMSWEDEPVEVEGQPKFGTPTSSILLAPAAGPLLHGAN
jgi:hypothetical protein